MSKHKPFKAVPSTYLQVCNQQGKVESLHYPVADLGEGRLTKHANVYVPFGYDEQDSLTSYNVFYLLHGGGEDENLLFGGPGEDRALKNILDHLIASKEIDPLIVVTPTFYGVKHNLESDRAKAHVPNLDHPLPLAETEYFHDEVVHDLIPYIEKTYRTYGSNREMTDLKATRSHRAFGGFSMGSVATWYTFIHALDMFKYFVPLSGDCWVLAQKAEGEKAEETAAYLANVPKTLGYKKDDYYLLCATGKKDIAYPNMKPQMEAIKHQKDSFTYNADLEKGNVYFIECEEGDHTWHWVNQYLYNILPDLFK